MSCLNILNEVIEKKKNRTFDIGCIVKVRW